MSQREAAQHKRPKPPAAFHPWHAESCPRLKAEPGEVCDGVSVWWMEPIDRRFTYATCLEVWEATKP